MGTRGLIIFKYKGQRYSVYSHFDSYPEYIGELLVILLKTGDYQKWGESLEFLFRNILGELKSKYDVETVINMDKVIEQMKCINGETKRRIVFKIDGTHEVVENYHKVVLGDFAYKPDSLIAQIVSKIADWIVTEPVEIYKPSFSRMMEWIYTVDLDANELTVKGYWETITFKLDDIPQNWISILYESTNKKISENVIVD